MRMKVLVTLLAASLTTALLFAGAPLKGVDVKLGRNPGGSAAARATTDANGAFHLPVVPKGSYELILSLPTARGAADRTAACTVTVAGAAGGPKTLGWDFEKKRAFHPGAASTARAAAADRLIVESDGSHPISGTIVKSKSNITNN